MTNFDWDLSGNNGGGGDKVEFTKFPVGITKIRVVEGQPKVRWTHFLPNFRRSINCPGRGCPICEIRQRQKANKEPYTYQMGRRVSIQIINRETGRLELMDQGTTFFEDLRDVMTDIASGGGNPLATDLKVRRRGTGQDDTSYRIDADEAYPNTQADEKLLLGKIDMEEFFKPHTPEQILKVLAVTSEFPEAWARIMKGEDEPQEATQNTEGNDNDLGEAGEEIELR